MPWPEVFVDLHLVLLSGNCVLLGERIGDRFGAGQFHVPAGHLESDETIIDGTIREAREETGIEIASADLDLAYTLHFRSSSDRLSLFFIARAWSGEIRNLEPEKCRGWGWWPVNELPSNTVSYARFVLGELLAGRKLGVYGWS